MDKFWKGFHKQIEEKAGIDRAKFTTEELTKPVPNAGSTNCRVKFGKKDDSSPVPVIPIATIPTERKRNRRRGRRAHCQSRSRAGRAGWARMSQMRWLAGLQIQPHRQPLHRLCQLPQVQTHRTAGKPKDTAGVSRPQCKRQLAWNANHATANSFYSCSTYPDCNYATWNPPIAEECPHCHWPVLTIKTTKRWGERHVSAKRVRLERTD